MRYWTTETGGLWRLGPEGSAYLTPEGEWKHTVTAADAAAGWDGTLDEITPEQAAAVAAGITRKQPRRAEFR